MQRIDSVHRVMLHTRAMGSITRYILENNLQPGDKLPSERQIAEQMGIGRNSLREALRVLEHNNTIEVRNGLGIFVGSAADDMGVSLRVNKSRVNLLELLDIRLALEMHAMALCVKNATDEQLREAGACLATLDLAAAEAIDVQALHDADAKYHRLVYSIGGNSTLCGMLVQIDNVASSQWQALEGHSQMFIDTLPMHHEQLNALMERNIKKVQDATRRLIRMDADSILKALPRRDGQLDAAFERAMDELGWILK